MSTTKTYDPSGVQTILGAAPITGFADGTFITVEQDEDSYATRTGADGEVVRTKMVARTATMTIVLLSTSLSNLILTGLHATEVIFPVLLKDGATIIAAGEAWVQKPASFERGVDAGDAEWVLRLAKWNPVHGGNPS